jgi:16S rRNA processing protein RimM
MFGVRGEVRIKAFSADPLALLGYRDFVGEDGAPGVSLASGRVAKGGLVARVKGVDTREAAEALQGRELYVSREALAAPDEDEFYVADLIGLEVRDAAGAVVGRVKTVEDFGAGDLLEIAPPAGPSYWLPFTREAVPALDVAAGWIMIARPAETE